MRNVSFRLFLSMYLWCLWTFVRELVPRRIGSLTFNLASFGSITGSLLGRLGQVP